MVDGSREAVSSRHNMVDAHKNSQEHDNMNETNLPKFKLDKMAAWRRTHGEKLDSYLRNLDTLLLLEEHKSVLFNIVSPGIQHTAGQAPCPQVGQLKVNLRD